MLTAVLLLVAGVVTSAAGDVPAAAPQPAVTPAVVDEPLDPGGSLTVDKRVRTPVVPPRPDVVLLVDGTGSMQPTIDNVQTNLGLITDRVREEQPDSRFAVATYGDQEVDGDRVFTVLQGLTDDLDAVQRGVDRLTADRGSYSPGPAEDWINALWEIGNGSQGQTVFRDGASPVVVLVGDASSHDPSKGHTLTDAVNSLTYVGARVIGVDVATELGDGLNGNGDNGNGPDQNREPTHDPDQATDVVQATGGRLFQNIDADQVADTVAQGLTNLPTTVTHQTVSCDPALSVTMDPPSRRVTSGETAAFDETITVADDAPQGATLSCTVQFLLDGRPPGGEAPVDVLPAREFRGQRIAPDDAAADETDGARGGSDAGSGDGSAGSSGGDSAAGTIAGAIGGVVGGSDGGRGSGLVAGAAGGLTSGSGGCGDGTVAGLAAGGIGGTDSGGNGGLLAGVLGGAISGSDGCGDGGGGGTNGGTSTGTNGGTSGGGAADGGSLGGALAGLIGGADGGRSAGVIGGVVDGVIAGITAGGADGSGGNQNGGQNGGGQNGGDQNGGQIGGDGDGGGQIGGDGNGGGQIGGDQNGGNQNGGQDGGGNQNGGDQNGGQNNGGNENGGQDGGVDGSGDPTPEDYQQRITITVNDVTAPVVTVDDRTVEATGSNGTVIDFTATAEDATDGALPITCDPASGSRFPVGTTTVTCTATDSSGNTGTGTATFTVTPAPTPNEADIAVTATTSPVPTYTGLTTRAGFTLTNAGPKAAKNVVLTTSWPRTDDTRERALSALSNCTPAKPCTIAPGGRILVTQTAVYDTAVSGEVRASVTGSPRDPRNANNTDTARFRVLQPKLTVTPQVARPGDVVVARGKDFPPGRTVALTWSPGITAAQSAVRVGPDGTFEAQVLVLRKDRTGPRTLRAQVRGLDRLTKPVLIVQHSLQPPDFAGRR
ncbi:HYR domain-containing protein [Streptomyces sp. NPDC056161]|uniref:HYR domain-containing protein n=1 Tax=Streptomyces sp. NPDC056161 TaxID=3345732 RepID=UPI0035D9D015